MSKFAEVYGKSIGRNISPDGIVETEEQPKNAEEINEDAARRQLVHQWLSSTVTQEHLQSLHKESESLIDHAISLAAGFHNHQNHYQIISNLIRANELRKIIKSQKTQ